MGAESISELLLDEYVARGITLARFSAGERRRVLAYLRKLEKDLVDKLRLIDPSEPIRARYRIERMAKLLEEVRATINIAYKGAAKTSAKGLRGLASTEAEWVRDTINAAGHFQLIDTALTAEQLKAITSNALIEGAPSMEWWSRQAKKLQESFADQIRQGMALGESVDEMVRRVRGKATGRRWKYYIGDKEYWYSEFTGGIMDTSTRNAQALVRTSVQQVAADARMEMYRANARVVKGVQQISTLDGRTTKICIAYSGMVWDLDGKPIGHSLAFNGGPPRHWNCRSVLLPVLRSYKDLGIDIDELPPMTRSSMDGQVAADISFGDWLAKKPAAFQDDLLGKGVADLWRGGKITLTDLVDQSGRPLSLRDLREKAAGSVASQVAKAASVVAANGIANLPAFGGKTFTDIKGTQAHMENEFAGWLESLSKEQRSAVSSYTEGGHEALNAYLYGSGAEDAGLEEFAAVLESALQSSSLPEDSILFRGTTLDELGVSSARDLTPGRTFTNNHFTSTSFIERKANNFADGMLLKIQAPEGTTGAYVSFEGLAAAGKTELEFIIQRGANFQILSFEEVDGTMVVEVRLLP